MKSCFEVIPSGIGLPSWEDPRGALRALAGGVSGNPTPGGAPRPLGAVASYRRQAHASPKLLAPPNSGANAKGWRVREEAQGNPPARCIGLSLSLRAKGFFPRKEFHMALACPHEGVICPERQRALAGGVRGSLLQGNPPVP